MILNGVMAVILRYFSEFGSLMGVGAGLYMYDVVVKKFTFAISSPGEFVSSVSLSVCEQIGCRTITSTIIIYRFPPNFAFGS